METIKIPGLPVNASRIGLGTWAIGGWMWGGSEESEAISTIQAPLDLAHSLLLNNILGHKIPTATGIPTPGFRATGFGHE